tara:strand:- start:46 stop:300 length:255 start_codon:yes stop_codon:yes gene_type:complete
MTKPFSIPEWDHAKSFNNACDTIEDFVTKHKDEGPLVMISLVRAMSVQMVNMSEGEDDLNDFVEMAISEIHSTTGMAKQTMNYE